MHYASKPDIDMAVPGLCIGGFTQPDKVAKLMQEFDSADAGMAQRFLFWCQPGKLYKDKSSGLPMSSFGPSMSSRA